MLIELTEFVNLVHIPLLRTGIEYPASTGNFTCTSEMLAEVVASQSDPHIIPPRIGIIHTDNAINEDLQALWEEYNATKGQGEPALGTIRNMTVENDGQDLFGDLYGLPSWLAAIMETAYPARSIEGGSWKNPANDKSYDFCLTGLALLGVVGPGCTSLADLQELFSVSGPKVQVIEMSGGKGEQVKPKTALQVNVEDIRRAFYTDFAVDERYWWWDRELMVDPLEFIVEGDEGQLYRLPVDLTPKTDGPDAVAFGNPKQVKIKYVNASSGRTLIAPQLEGTGAVLAINTEPPRAAERGTRRSHMALSAEAVAALRTTRGLSEEQLPDDPSEDQINAAILAPPLPLAGPTAKKSDDVKVDEDKPVDDPPTPALAAATVDPAALQQLQADAAMGRQARQEQVKMERDQYIEKAVKAGKFARTVAPSYRAQLEISQEVEKSTREFIDKLAVGVAVPINELGGDDNISHATDYIDEHLSDSERRRIAAARSGEPVTLRVISEAS